MSKPIYLNVLNGKKLDGQPEACWQMGKDPASSYVAGPAFFDPQVNGFAGVDFQNPDITLGELEFALREIHRAGCSHILLTLITNSIDSLRFQFRHLASLTEESELVQQTVLGFHLEGPFISSQPGFHGAHPRECVCEPDWGTFMMLQEASGGKIRLVTLAPELEGSAEFIRKVSRSGVLVSLGHTDAGYDQLLSAVQAGARMVTHLGNGCPEQLHRHDNIIQRVLAIPDLLVSLIPDGIHLPPYVLSNLARCLGTARIVMTTDAMSAAAAPPGEYTIGRLRVVVGEDRIVMVPGGRNFAGSSLRMVEGFYNCVRFGGLDIGDAWRTWTRLRETLFPHVDPPWLAVPFGQDAADSRVSPPHR